MANLSLIKQLFDEIGNLSNNNLSEFHSLIKLLFLELDKIDPAQIETAHQLSFIKTRKLIQSYSVSSFADSTYPNEIKKLGNKITECLNHQKKVLSEKEQRSFEFIVDPEIKKIVVRDYSELTDKLTPQKALKSMVIMSGSILEAILCDALSKNEGILRAVRNSSLSLKDSNGNLVDIKGGKWKLYKLIEVAEDVGILPSQRIKAIDQILRDFRNFIHPIKEVESQMSLEEPEAFLALNALDMVCNHLLKTNS